MKYKSEHTRENKKQFGKYKAEQKQTRNDKSIKTKQNERYTRKTTNRSIQIKIISETTKSYKSNSEDNSDKWKSRNSNQEIQFGSTRRTI